MWCGSKIVDLLIFNMLKPRSNLPEYFYKAPAYRKYSVFSYIFGEALPITVHSKQSWTENVLVLNFY